MLEPSYSPPLHHDGRFCRPRRSRTRQAPRRAKEISLLEDPFARIDESSQEIAVNWIATVLKSLPVWLRSPGPLEKKEFAASQFCSVKVRVRVRAMVDLPVPAMPFNQNIVFSLWVGAPLHDPAKNINTGVWGLPTLFWLLLLCVQRDTTFKDVSTRATIPAAVMRPSIAYPEAWRLSNSRVAGSSILWELRGTTSTASIGLL